jgi:hypothetical protein
MLTTRSCQHSSLGKEGVPTNHALYVVRIGLQKDQVRSTQTHAEAHTHANRPEVNQTKPKLVTVGDKIRADSAGYAPQA